VFAELPDECHSTLSSPSTPHIDGPSPSFDGHASPGWASTETVAAVHRRQCLSAFHGIFNWSRPNVAGTDRWRSQRDPARAITAGTSAGPTGISSERVRMAPKPGNRQYSAFQSPMVQVQTPPCGRLITCEDPKMGPSATG